MSVQKPSPTAASAILALFIFPPSLLGAQARLLADIDKRPAITSSDIQPGTKGPFARLGTRLLFTAKLRRDVSSLVTWDPATTAMNVLVPQLEDPSPSQFRAASLSGGRALITIAGPALAVMDGTPSGTTILRQSSSSGARGFVPLGSRMLFDDEDAIVGRELFITDGTVQGTRLVADFEPGSGSSQPVVLGVNPSGTLAIVFATPSSGSAVFATDGTAQGTVLLAKVEAPRDQRLAWLDATRFVFSANDGSSGFEPWVSDGTTAGTKRIADVHAGSASSSPASFVRLGTRVLFRAAPFPDDQKLYSTDGNSVTLVTRLAQHPTGIGVFDDPIEFSGRVFFLGGGGSATGHELYVTDGTAQGTGLFVDIAAGAASSNPQQFVVSGSRLYFSAYEPGSGIELYVCGGTAQTTRRVADIAPGTESSSPFNITPLASGAVAFVADDTAHGSELWVADPALTAPVRYDFYDVPNATFGSFPHNFVSIGDRVIFAEGSSVVPSRLWATDGSSAGTVPVLSQQVQMASTIVSIGSRALFSASTATTTGLWVTDGTAAGTKLSVMGLHTPLWPIGPGRALFHSALVIGITDGSPNGTVGFLPLTQRGDIAAVSRENDDGDFVFVHDAWLWRSDGTSVGTKQVIDLAATFSISNVREMVPFGRRWFFNAVQAGIGLELWSTDGTAAGTALVRDIYPGPDSSLASGLCVQDGRLWFSATDGRSGEELWVSDGTAQGTRLVVDAIAGSGSLSARRLTAVGTHTIYFDANVPGLGREPCRLDTRTQQLSLVADVDPGLASSREAPSPFFGTIEPFCVLGDEVFFRANDGVHGWEPYVAKHGAIATKYGRDCGSASLDTSSDPRLNSSVNLSYATSRSGARAHVLIFGSPDYAGTMLQRPGCQANITLATLTPIAAFAGTSWNLGIAIPAQTSLIGARMGWQVASVDLLTSSIETSNAVEWVLGR